MEKLSGLVDGTFNEGGFTNELGVYIPRYKVLKQGYNVTAEQAQLYCAAYYENYDVKEIGYENPMGHYYIYAAFARETSGPERGSIYNNLK